MGSVDDDPYLWLEDITGDDALDWVRKHNEPTLAEFGGTRFEQMRTEALEVLDTEARIPYVRRRGDYLYNFWRDAANPRGLWRRTTLESYRTDEPDWNVIFDVDALADTEDENWVWAGADVLEPDYSVALIELSRGGADATVVREFDMEKREFVADGFVAGSRHRAGGHGIRLRFDDRVRLPPHREAVATRPTARRSPDSLRG
jgi:prolyl oligopeptidase